MMNRTVDLTKNNFDRIDFQEAKILNFDYFDKPSDSMEFRVWGARLLVDDFWDHDKSFLSGFPHTDDYYVAGEGTIKIQQVSGIKVCFFPYQKENEISDFIYDSEGKVVEKKWEWGEMQEENTYLWECVLVTPHGYINLEICAHGNVEYAFNDEEIVFEKEFLQNPLKYSYKYLNT